MITPPFQLVKDIFYFRMNRTIDTTEIFQDAKTLTNSGEWINNELNFEGEQCGVC